MIQLQCFTERKVAKFTCFPMAKEKDTEGETFAFCKFVVWLKVGEYRVEASGI